MSRAQEGEASDRLTLDNIADIVNVSEAAAATRLSRKTIRSAAASGELPSFIPGDRDVRKTGRGMGYRFHKADLQRWFFGPRRGDA